MKNQKLMELLHRLDEQKDIKAAASLSILSLAESKNAKATFAGSSNKKCQPGSNYVCANNGRCSGNGVCTNNRKCKSD